MSCTAFYKVIGSIKIFLAEIKKQPRGKFQSYIQMFDDKHGFLPNLSILDLLFMEGPNAMNISEHELQNLYG